MSDRITVRDCERVAVAIGHEMKRMGLLPAGEWADCPSHLVRSYVSARLIVEAGSATYGRSWRVFVTGGRFGTAWHETPFGDLRSGSARELCGKMAAVLRTLEAVQRAVQRAEAVAAVNA